MNHSGPERGLIKETKKAWHLPVSLNTFNVFQIFLNSPSRFLWIDFGKLSAAPIIAALSLRQNKAKKALKRMSKNSENKVVSQWEKDFLPRLVVETEKIKMTTFSFLLPAGSYFYKCSWLAPNSFMMEA